MVKLMDVSERYGALRPLGLTVTEWTVGGRGWEEKEGGVAPLLSAQHAASTWMSYTGLEEGMAANCR